MREVYNMSEKWTQFINIYKLDNIYNKYKLLNTLNMFKYSTPDTITAIFIFDGAINPYSLILNE